MCQKTEDGIKRCFMHAYTDVKNLKDSKRLIGKEQRILDDLDDLDDIISILSNPVLPFESRLKYEKLLLSDEEIAFAYYTRAYRS